MATRSKSTPARTSTRSASECTATRSPDGNKKAACGPLFCCLSRVASKIHCHTPPPSSHPTSVILANARIYAHTKSPFRCDSLGDKEYGLLSGKDLWCKARIAEVVAQTRFAIAAELVSTLTKYVKGYNCHIPQRNLGHLTPLDALKAWRDKAPDLFKKRPKDLPGLTCNQRWLRRQAATAPAVAAGCVRGGLPRRKTQRWPPQDGQLARGEGLWHFDQKTNALRQVGYQPHHEPSAMPPQQERCRQKVGGVFR